jgi:hypothetical protein
MGMYTELILGAELRKDTPKEVIEALQFILGEKEIKPENFPLPEGRCDWLLQGCSSSFAIDKPVNKMWLGEWDNCWHISTRSNIKNYGGEIEEFLAWLKPYIDGGSGNRDMYAIVIYEDEPTPTMHYLHED